MLGEFFGKILLPPSQHLAHQHTRKKRETAKYMLVDEKETAAPTLPAAAGLPSNTLAFAHSQNNTQGLTAPAAAIGDSDASPADD
ncbi:hypothetical protein [Sporisorium scitamineum]|uniref:Uncharacterized protein n=1 Tax=Sporisorium scitamineum TaxID=49012 RepID=A0A0F7RU39_9BASI|nr:hypothetical protein [Sporisorium scitamineum]